MKIENVTDSTTPDCLYTCLLYTSVRTELKRITPTLCPRLHRGLLLRYVYTLILQTTQNNRTHNTEYYRILQTSSTSEQGTRFTWKFNSNTSQAQKKTVRTPLPPNSENLINTLRIFNMNNNII